MFYLNYWGSQPPFLIKKLYLLQIFPPNLMFFFYCSLLLLLLFWLTGTFWIYMWFGGNFIFKKLEVELKTLSSCTLEAQTWDLGLLIRHISARLKFQSKQLKKRDVQRIRFAGKLVLRCLAFRKGSPVTAVALVRKG